MIADALILIGALILAAALTGLVGRTLRARRGRRSKAR